MQAAAVRKSQTHAHMIILYSHGPVCIHVAYTAPISNIPLLSVGSVCRFTFHYIFHTQEFCFVDNSVNVQ